MGKFKSVLGQIQKFGVILGQIRGRFRYLEEIWTNPEILFQYRKN